MAQQAKTVTLFSGENFRFDFTYYLKLFGWICQESHASMQEYCLLEIGISVHFKTQVFPMNWPWRTNQRFTFSLENMLLLSFNIFVSMNIIEVIYVQ